MYVKKSNSTVISHIYLLFIFSTTLETKSDCSDKDEEPAGSLNIVMIIVGSVVVLVGCTAFFICRYVMRYRAARGGFASSGRGVVYQHGAPAQGGGAVVVGAQPPGQYPSSAAYPQGVTNQNYDHSGVKY